MADIISLQEKKQHCDRRQAASHRKRKVLAVQKIFHCTHCASKCEKCGTQIGMEQQRQKAMLDLRVPYRFCESCAKDYVDYIDRLKGAAPDCYWHNDAWLKMWRAWIDYQHTIDQYVKSKEFMRLLRELKHAGPGE